MKQSGIHALLEKYVLSCIGFLPVELEAYMSRRIQRTYRQEGDWKTILRGVLHLDGGLDSHLRQMWDAHQKRAAASGAPPNPEQFARLALEDECFAQTLARMTPRPPPIAPPNPWGAVITVKAIGFWRHMDGSFPMYPKAQALVQPGWHAAELERIIAYLRSGYNAHPNLAFCGWSTCRFAGCVEGEYNGTRELTDGEWGWPEGLAHYVERHAVILPEEFIATMRVNHWHVPPTPDPPHLTQFDPSFWINWASPFMET